MVGTEGRAVGGVGVGGGTACAVFRPGKPVSEERAGVAAQDICPQTFSVVDTARERQAVATHHSPRETERLVGSSYLGCVGMCPGPGMEQGLRGCWRRKEAREGRQGWGPRQAAEMGDDGP